MVITDHPKTGQTARFIELFDDVSRRFPRTVALVYGDQSLTYEELNQRANQLAHHLVQLGVGPGMPVGLCINRSLEMVVGILGILKAGGAYVPLDPSYPQDRLAFILEDSRSRVVVTQSAYLPSYLQQAVQAVCLDVDLPVIARCPVHAPRVGITGNTLAYVIYTSGSTGKPKGVMITHSNLAHFIQIAGSALPVHPDDVYLQSASVSYALSVRQLVIPLASGATIVIATSDELHDPLLLFQLIKDRRITIMDVVPSFWRSCYQRLAGLPAVEAKALLDNSLRRIVSIGEALLSDLPRDWAALAGHKTELVNIFGQTETTGVVATYPIPPEGPERAGIVPIGRSVADTRLYLLGPDLLPVPDGEQGELCVSNPCVGLGYLNRPELTGQKFIQNPFDDGFSPRLYRTGDLARRREDGNIEYLGRGDHQVKIRGQRLEPGEVEAAIRQHKAVSECVVVARGENPDERYLAAYIVRSAGSGEDSAITAAALREFARSRLPDYMVPSAFVFLESMPLTPNGKINRLALPDPTSALAGGALEKDEAAQPQDAIEANLLKIWQDLMNGQPVGIHDNFFELGGHSLMAVQLFSRVEQEFGVRFPITLLIQFPTVAKLAEKIQQSRGQAALDQVLVPLQTGGTRRPFFLVHGVGGGVLGYRDLVNAVGEDQPIYGLQAIGMNEQCSFDESIETMAARYIEVMRTLQPEGPYQLGGYCFGGVVAFEIACQLEQQGQKVSLLAIFEGYLPNQTSPGIPFPQRISAFFKHIPYWYKDYSGMSAKDLWYRARATCTKLWLRLRHHPDLQRRLRVEEILDTDLSKVPARSIELTQVHSKALHSYNPRQFSGQITVFRARARSLNEVLFGSMDEKMGWGKLAAGGVAVRLVDGFHRNIHLPPYVSSLAAELNHCLGKDH